MTVVLVRTQLSNGLTPQASVILQNRHGTVSASVTTTPFAATPDIVPMTDEHLRAEADERDPVWLSIADVIVRTTGPACLQTPGCMLAAVVTYGRERVLARDGQLIEVNAAGPAGMFVSFVHAWMVSGRTIADLDGASLRMSSGLWRTVHVNLVA